MLGSEMKIQVEKNDEGHKNGLELPPCCTVASERLEQPAGVVAV